MALRNCILLTRRRVDSVFRAKASAKAANIHILPTRRLLHRCTCLKVAQFSLPRLLKESSGALNSGFSLSCRRLATESGDRKDVEQHPGKTKQDESDVDLAWPNDAWSDVAKEIFHQLNAGTENGDWKRHPGYLRAGERRLFSRNIGEQGKGFEYAIFVNKREQRASCVCQFGPYLEGGPGHVHGGAVATLLDAVMGICAIRVMEGPSVTANLSINYKNPIPLGSTVLFHAKLDRQDDRKGYLSAYVTSADGHTTLCEATALFIKLSREQMEKAKNHLPQDAHKLLSYTTE